MKAMTKQIRERIESLEFELKRSKDMEDRYHAYVCKVDAAIEGLMRDVLAEVIDQFSHPNSIAAGRLIAAVAKASATIHQQGH